MNPVPLTVKAFVDSTFGENAYVLSAPTEPPLAGWIIDPGFPPQTEHLLAYVAEQAMSIERILLTHGHIDHIAGVDVVHAAHPAARIAMAREDQGAIASADQNLSGHFGFPMAFQSRADEDLAPVMELKLGSLTWRVLDVSGHSPGGRALYCPQAGVVFVGDALFAGSIGRTDLPGMDGDRLVTNIRRNLLTLPGDTVVYPGHGPATTVEIERKSNPFITDAGE